MKPLKEALRRISPSIYRMSQNVYTLAIRYGQLRSIRSGEPVAADGTPLPWYSYPAIEYLDQFDFSARRVFEFGAGNSSLYWANRALELVTVENDAAWFERVRTAARPNHTLLLRETRNAYVGALAEQSGLFDLIVIDGRWRQSCALAAADKLADGGLIVLDNSDKHASVAGSLRGQGFFETDFSGFGPVNNYTWTTSVFLRANTRLQQRYGDPVPLAGRGVVIDAEEGD